jgi:hypothetical protein
MSRNTRTYVSARSSQAVPITWWLSEAVFVMCSLNGVLVAKCDFLIRQLCYKYWWITFVVSSSLMKDYFFKPPINQFSLNFLDQELERSYRTSYQEEVSSLCNNRNLSSHRSFTLFCTLASDRKMKTNVDFPQSVSLKLQLCINLSLPRTHSVVLYPKAKPSYLQAFPP